MHELSIAISIVEAVLDKLEERGGGAVETVHLKIGVFSGVDKDALDFAYDLACEGTALAGSLLIVEDVPLRIYCPKCAAEREALSMCQLCCNVCGFPAEKITQGKDLELKAFEVAA
jgi:hydrogenase nickel incorporation protein HypA/HybF